jgi:hypothetical protein
MQKRKKQSKKRKTHKRTPKTITYLVIYSKEDEDNESVIKCYTLEEAKSHIKQLEATGDDNWDEVDINSIEVYQITGKVGKMKLIFN